jgi:glutamate racemase
MMTAPLLVFDSGVGGLTVAREIRRHLPAATMVYVADDAAFPYGDWEDHELSNHVVALMARLIADLTPVAVVIACNTASTLVLARLRQRFSIPFVGTVPAIKPAAEQTSSGLVSVLATPGTIRRDYTRDLIRSFARACRVTLVGSAHLAGLAEVYVRTGGVDDRAVSAEIAPAFVSTDKRRTDMVVLACTHYPFLLARLQAVAQWPVTWIDPASAIARRVAAVVGAAADGGGGGVAHLTSGKDWHPALAAVAGGIGLEPMPTARPLVSVAQVP